MLHAALLWYVTKLIALGTTSNGLLPVCGMFVCAGLIFVPEWYGIKPSLLKWAILSVLALVLIASIFLIVASTSVEVPSAEYCQIKSLLNDDGSKALTEVIRQNNGVLTYDNVAKAAQEAEANRAKGEVEKRLLKS